MKDFLPITKEDMMKRGWTQPDFVFVIGDAYVDHSSFGPAIISRVLESHGYKVAIISQPDWTDDESITTFGEPRLGFLVCAGNMDSMVNHYTVSKKRRSTDAYTPGGVIGKRPDYATIVYCNLIKRKYKNTPIMIGGIEASLRRLGHYDYWSNKMKRSILMDSGADLLMYGMGELACVAIADALDSGIAVHDITFVPGTVYKSKDVSGILAGESGKKGIELPDFDEINSDRKAYARSFFVQYQNTDFYSACPLVEKYGEKRYVVQNPPSRPLTTQEFDDVYELPYMNTYHPSYEAAGGVPAISEIKFSLTSNRGCFGGCSFCALTFHQGRVLQVRSHESLIREAEAMTKDPEFKGYIHDVGGPTANFRRPACDKQLKYGACTNKQCLYPDVCKNMKVDHSDYVALLRKLRKLPGVKKVFVRSGIRFDYMLADKDDTFLEELCKYHVSGQLRVAPEHVTDHVLDLMGKPRAQVYEKFVDKFKKVNDRLGLKQYVVPYLISSHPGSDLKDAIALAESIRDMGYMPEQVQDFYPTPSTISTCMYYCGVDPRNMKPVNVTVNPHEKAMQRALIQYRRPENYDLVKEALIKEGREDLIGFGPGCLIPPRKMGGKNSAGKPAGNGGKYGSNAGAAGSNKSEKKVNGKSQANSSRENNRKNVKGPIAGGRGKDQGFKAGREKGQEFKTGKQRQEFQGGKQKGQEFQGGSRGKETRVQGKNSRSGKGKR
ncbi:MAG: YgiQ family radical SAM protein [Lachnospiraceae bacterium]|nr:YgiQ family radical SAM protein [Lachnospiraceae bacterium]